MNQLILSHARGPTDRPLLDLTLGALLDRSVQLHPENDALVSRHQGLRYSYREFLVEVEQCARALLAIGLKKGDRIGIWSPNYAEWSILQFGSSKIGAILVNINPAYRLAELEYALNVSGCRALVTAERLKTSMYLQMLQTLAPELATCAPGELKCAKLPALQWVIRLGSEATPGMLNYDALLERGTALAPGIDGFDVEQDII